MADLLNDLDFSRMVREELFKYRIDCVVKLHLKNSQRLTSWYENYIKSTCPVSIGHVKRIGYNNI